MEYLGKDKTTWDTEINAYLFEDAWKQVLSRLYPDSQFENNSSGETGQALYDLIKPYQLAGQTKIYDVKLDYATDVLDELALYKADELRKIDQRFRLMGFLNWKQSAINAGIFSEFSNFALLTEKIINENLETELVLMEVEDAILKTAEADKKTKKDESDLSIQAFKDMLPDLKTGTKLTSKEQEDLFILLIEAL